MWSRMGIRDVSETPGDVDLAGVACPSRLGMPMDPTDQERH
jgi:hypothetical protein